MFTETKDLQLKNAPSILVTVFGSSIWVSDVQSLKVSISSVTEAGMTTRVRDEQ